MSAEETPRREPEGTPFSYVCHRCLRCCHDKLIQVNPYEAARLARRLGKSTTEFIAEHLEDGVFLRRVESGACAFLGAEGCTVHPDRPLVCRLYPLGRHVGPDGSVTYSHHAPHPETEGVYGQAGTIGDFLAQQGVAPFAAAADHYLALLQKLYDAWRDAGPAAVQASASARPEAADEPALLDLDQAVAAYCAGRGLPEPLDIDERMHLHLAAVTEWLARQDRPRP